VRLGRFQWINVERFRVLLTCFRKTRQDFEIDLDRRKRQQGIRQISLLLGSINPVSAGIGSGFCVGQLKFDPLLQWAKGKMVDCLYVPEWIIPDVLMGLAAPRQVNSCTEHLN
jgi:hypothetical protein